MATGPRPWLITFCITLIYVKRTCPKIVEGTIDTKEVSPLNDKIWCIVEPQIKFKIGTRAFERSWGFANCSVFL